MKKALSSASERTHEGKDYCLIDERSHCGSEEEQMLSTSLMQGQRRLQKQGNNSKHGLEVQAGSPGLSGIGEDLSKLQVIWRLRSVCKTRLVSQTHCMEDKTL